MYQTFIIPYLYEAQHVSRDTPPIIRSLKLHWQPLVFHTWKVDGRVVGGRCQAVPGNVVGVRCQAVPGTAWQRPPTTHPTTFHVWKTRGCQCSFRLLMMGGVSLETCWASYKYGIIKVWYIVASCWIFLYESYYDARIHEHQVNTYCFSTAKMVWRIRLSCCFIRRLAMSIIQSRWTKWNLQKTFNGNRCTKNECVTSSF